MRSSIASMVNLLELREERFRSIFESANDAIFILDRESGGATIAQLPNLKGQRAQLLLLVPVAVLGGLWAFGVSLSTAIPYAFLLACPLMMVFMMRGMDHGSSTSAAADANKTAMTTKIAFEVSVAILSLSKDWACNVDFKTATDSKTVSRTCAKIKVAITDAGKCKNVFVQDITETGSSTKVCAVDEVWSALKLVIRKELR